MEQNGKISVLMGVYNCAQTLPEAIESILSQTYSNWELIVCDDCSDDDTYAVACAYRERYPEKITVLKNDTHAYLAHSLNRCLEKATGEFIARMDGDDRSLPTRFEKQVSFLKTHPDIVLVGTAVSRFDGDQKVGRDLVRPARPDRMTPYTTVSFNHATVMAYTHVFVALGGYTVLPRTRRGQDRDLWFRFFDAGYAGANLPDVLYEVRETNATYKRRSLATRIMTCQTMWFGYRLLRYPWHWYWKIGAEFCKAFIPTACIRWYRKRQAKR